MRKADLINRIAEKTGIPKVDSGFRWPEALSVLSQKKELLKLAETLKKILL